jgi:hypothetical protein
MDGYGDGIEQGDKLYSFTNLAHVFYADVLRESFDPSLVPCSIFLYVYLEVSRVHCTVPVPCVRK